MVELHGWVTIRESYKVDNEEDYIGTITKQIQEYIKRFDWGGSLMELKYYNGVPCLTISLYKNRYSYEVKKAFEILDYIAEVAVGSYGMVYLHDDENIEGEDNIFQVFVLSRGKVKKYHDNFLSPIIPKVEDFS